MLLPVGNSIRYLTSADLESLTKNLPELDPHDPPSSDIWISWLSRAYECDSSKADVLRSVVSRISMFDCSLALKTIDCILETDPAEFISACFFLKHRPESKSVIRIPKPLRALARIEGTYKGWTMGEGELVIPFICSRASCSFGGRDDVTIIGEKWHVKKMERDRAARMGTSAATTYGSSETAFRLSKIDRVFSNKITEQLLQQYEQHILAEFGSREAFKREFARECIAREFSDCVGMCVFDARRNNLEFYRSTDVEPVNPKQGRYFLRVPSLKTPVKRFASALRKMDVQNMLYRPGVVSMFFVSSDSDEVLKIVEVVDSSTAPAEFFASNHFGVPVSIIKVSLSEWNNCMSHRTNVILPPEWTWNNRKPIR